MRALGTWIGKPAEISSGSMEALKWLAVLLMTLDHVNLHLLNSAHPWMFIAGRLSWPLFAWVLASNLARNRQHDPRLALRVLGRLLPCMVIAELPYRALNYAEFGFLPLNILFTLGTGVAIIALLESHRRFRLVLAILFFSLSGPFIDYGWAGSSLLISIWFFLRAPGFLRILPLLAAMVALSSVNTNSWAYAAALPLLLAMNFQIAIPRLRNALYLYYPAHLAVIVVLQLTLFVA